MHQATDETLVQKCLHHYKQIEMSATPGNVPVAPDCWAPMNAGQDPRDDPWASPLGSLSHMVHTLYAREQQKKAPPNLMRRIVLMDIFRRKNLADAFASPELWYQVPSSSLCVAWKEVIADNVKLRPLSEVEVHNPNILGGLFPVGANTQLCWLGSTVKGASTLLESSHLALQLLHATSNTMSGPLSLGDALDHQQERCVLPNVNIPPGGSGPSRKQNLATDLKSMTRATHCHSALQGAILSGRLLGWKDIDDLIQRWEILTEVMYQLIGFNVLRLFPLKSRGWRPFSIFVPFHQTLMPQCRPLLPVFPPAHLVSSDDLLRKIFITKKVDWSCIFLSPLKCVQWALLSTKRDEFNSPDAIIRHVDSMSQSDLVIISYICLHVETHMRRLIRRAIRLLDQEYRADIDRYNEQYEPLPRQVLHPTMGIEHLRAVNQSGMNRVANDRGGVDVFGTNVRVRTARNQSQGFSAIGGCFTVEDLFDSVDQVFCLS